MLKSHEHRHFVTVDEVHARLPKVAHLQLPLPVRDHAVQVRDHDDDFLAHAFHHPVQLHAADHDAGVRLGHAAVSAAVLALLPSRPR
eukprot:6930389-Pyramimonas_sp.AAC.1